MNTTNQPMNTTNQSTIAAVTAQQPSSLVPTGAVVSDKQRKKNEFNQMVIKLGFLGLGCLLILGGIAGAIALRLTATTYDSISTGQPVSADIVKTTIIKDKDTGRTKGYTCKFSITYTFQLEGKTYEGNDVVSISTTSSNNDCTDEAQQLRTEFLTSQQKFDVWYAPDNPNDNSYNEPLTPAQKAGVTGGILCGAGLLLLIVGACCAGRMLACCCGIPPPEPYSTTTEFMFRVGCRALWMDGSNTYANDPPRVCTQQELDRIVSLSEPLSKIIYGEYSFAIMGFTMKKGLLGEKKILPVMESLHQTFPHLEFEIEPIKVSETCNERWEHLVTVKPALASP